MAATLREAPTPACDAVLLTRPDVIILQDLWLLRHGDVRVVSGNASTAAEYNLALTVLFATSRTSRCDAKAADFFVLVEPHDLQALGEPADAACDYPGVEPPSPERELMRALLIQHGRAAFYLDGVAGVLRRHGLEKCSCPP